MQDIHREIFHRALYPEFFRMVFVVLLISYSGFTCADSIAKGDMSPTSARQQELFDFVRQDCGSCHGLLFEGGLGPPLMPVALKNKSAESLRDAIWYGRGTMMPPWSPFLSEAETDWIVQMLLKGLP
ncbi:MAG TPA: cytochrome c [Gallionellaceae bacterium]|nr:cytochrome c [Gallionellaceae bacterium]